MLPIHLQADFDKLSPYKKEKFMELVMWSNAGEPGKTLMSDHAYYKIFDQVARMDEPIIEPAQEVSEEQKKEE